MFHQFRITAARKIQNMEIFGIKNIKIVGYKNHVFNTPWKYFQQNLCFLCEDKNLVPILLVITHWARLLFSFSIILLFMVSCKSLSPIHMHCSQICTIQIHVNPKSTKSSCVLWNTHSHDAIIKCEQYT